MANVETTVLIDGKVELPAQTLKARHWHDGSRLKVIETSDGLLLKEEESASPRDSNISYEGLLAANKQRLGLPADYEGWRALEGILADSPIDLNEERKKERLRELERDDRWRD